MIKHNMKLILGLFIIISPNILNAENKFPVFKKTVCKVEINKNKFQELYLDIADTEQKRSYGLMNRKNIEPNTGMLFVWRDKQIRNFWMKNTYFNIDLFFLNKKGKILEVYENAKAFDETNIRSKNKVNFVVELKSGEYKFLKGDIFSCPFEELLK